MADQLNTEQLIAAIREEFQKHNFDTFVENPPSMAQGGRGVVVPGCTICRIRIQTTEQFVQHLEEKVLAACAAI